MELMWLVYFVENLTYNGSFFFGVSILLLVGTGLAVFATSVYFITESKGEYNFSNWWKNTYPKKTVISLLVTSLLLHVVLPTRDTAIKMAGAYLLQSVVTNDKTKELGDAAYRATLRQLTKWSEEVPELADMLIDAGKEKLESEIKAN